VAEKTKDPAIAALANTLSNIPHPGGQELRLVMFDGASDSVKTQVAEGIVHFLRKNGHMPYPRSTKRRTK
jgi:hypothetical protein